MVKINKKEIISLVKNDFIPLEESKEGALKGGFGSVMIEAETSSARAKNNCMCNGNNCMWCNEGRDNCHCPDGGCDLPDERDVNNCNCGTTLPPTTPKSDTSIVSLNWLPGAGFSF